MKVTVDIEDKHYDDFAELVKALDYAKLEAQYVIPEWQQNLVRERFEKIDRGEMELHELDDVMKRVFGKK
ncbi:MAG: hypothetical protein JKX84_03360 [Flavobacteriales bacterium]|nr:hypothetical protein [Flavobacteriales bacterium]